MPTEAEWEYAARGGLRDPYYQFPWGDDIDPSRANYEGTSMVPYEGLIIPFRWTTPVGLYMANGYGLYDMAGNVSEYCNCDHSVDPYPFARGGAYDSPERALRCSSRALICSPEVTYFNVGFRVAARN